MADSDLQAGGKATVIVLAIISGAIGAWIYDKVLTDAQSFDLLEDDIRSLEIDQKATDGILDGLRKDIWLLQLKNSSAHTVDFTMPDIQEIGDGFALSRASQSAHLTGIKFQGRIINKQSVAYQNVTFKLNVASVSKDFTINKISAGNSTAFEVYVPDIEATEARYADVSFANGTVLYLIK